MFNIIATIVEALVALTVVVFIASLYGIINL
jgi:hypothetical protein